MLIVVSAVGEIRHVELVGKLNDMVDVGVWRWQSSRGKQLKNLPVFSRFPSFDRLYPIVYIARTNFMKAFQRDI